MDFLAVPMLNILLWLYGIVGDFVLAIVIFTIFTRLIVLPLTIQQQKNSQKMAALQPQIKEIQDKYKNDPQKMQEEMNRIGWSPGMLLGGCLPMVVQLVILWGLWQAITRVLATSPIDLLNLASSIYNFLPDLLRLLPVNHTFLWLDLGQRDPTYILPLLVAASTYFSQKAYTPPSTGNPQDSTAMMNRQMQVIMPVMLGFFALNFPSALSIYWVFGNLLQVGQYYALQATGIVPKVPMPAPGVSLRPVSTQRPASGESGGASKPAPKAAASGPAPSTPHTSRPASRARKVRTRKPRPES